MPPSVVIPFMIPIKMASMMVGMGLCPFCQSHSLTVRHEPKDQSSSIQQDTTNSRLPLMAPIMWSSKTYQPTIHLVRLILVAVLVSMVAVDLNLLIVMLMGVVTQKHS